MPGITASSHLTNIGDSPRRKNGIGNEDTYERYTGHKKGNIKRRDIFERLEIALDKQDKVPAKKELGDFQSLMTLLAAQLKCQDPMDPIKNEAMVAQIAQLNTVDQLQQLNKGVKSFEEHLRSDRILAATSVIGKEVKVLTDKIKFEVRQEGNVVKTDLIQGVMKIPELYDEDEIIACKMEILNQKGEVVDSKDFANAIAGKDFPFNWMGLDPNGQRIKGPDGQPISDGDYTILAQVKIRNSEGEMWIPVDTEIATKVKSVGVKDGIVRFYFQGLGESTLNQLGNISSEESISRAASMQGQQAVLPPGEMTTFERQILDTIRRSAEARREQVD